MLSFESFIFGVASKITPLANHRFSASGSLQNCIVLKDKLDNQLTPLLGIDLRFWLCCNLELKCHQKQVEVHDASLKICSWN